MNQATDQAAGASEGTPSAEGGGGKRRGSRLIMLVLLPIVIVAAGAAAAYFTGLLDGVLGGAPVDEAAPPPKEVPISELKFVDVPGIVATLRPDGDRSVYLRMKVSLAVATEADVAQLQRLMPVVRDRINVYLSQRTLQDVTGPGAFGRLNGDLRQGIQAALGDVDVHRMVISDLIVQ